MDVLSSCGKKFFPVVNYLLEILNTFCITVCSAEWSLFPLLKSDFRVFFICIFKKQTNMKTYWLFWFYYLFALIANLSHCFILFLLFLILKYLIENCRPSFFYSESITNYAIVRNSSTFTQENKNSCNCLFYLLLKYWNVLSQMNDFCLKCNL